MARSSVVVRRGDVAPLPVLGCEVRFLCEAARTDHTFSVMEVSLPLGQGPPPHDHPWDEAYYVLEGQVRFLVGGEEAIHGPGDFLYAPGGVVHAFQGAGATPARVLVIDAPATVEGFFRDAAREVVNLPADLARVPAIGLRHGLHFLPPPPAGAEHPCGGGDRLP